MVASWRPVGARTTRSGHLQLVKDDTVELLAHDLRSPLATIAMNLDFTLSELGPDLPPSVRGALEDCSQSSQVAVTLVADMVDALLLASGELRPRLDDVDVQTLLASVVQDIATEASSRGVQLTWEAEPSVVRADAGLLHRALQRVLARALRYARSGAVLDVTLRTGMAAVRVRSTHSEPLAAEAGMRALAMRFADAALRAQGGAVWVEAEPDGGLLFCVALPP